MYIFYFFFFSESVTYGPVPHHFLSSIQPETTMQHVLETFSSPQEPTATLPCPFASIDHLDFILSMTVTYIPVVFLTMSFLTRSSTNQIRVNNRLYSPSFVSNDVASPRPSCVSFLFCFIPNKFRSIF